MLSRVPYIGYQSQRRTPNALFHLGNKFAKENKTQSSTVFNNDLLTLQKDRPLSAPTVCISPS